MDELRSLLKQVKDGKTSFHPEGPSKDQLQQFQPIAKALVHAKQMGYLEDCLAHLEAVTGNRYYAFVLLRGGLSYSGEQFLNHMPGEERQASVQPKTSENEDIIDLKPNFMGFGVNLNALWRWLKRGKA